MGLSGASYEGFYAGNFKTSHIKPSKQIFFGEPGSMKQVRLYSCNARSPTGGYNPIYIRGPNTPQQIVHTHLM